MDVKNALAKLAILAEANSAEIALGGALAGVPITALLFGRARLKADDILAEIEDERCEQNILVPMTTGEKVGATWKCYILPTIACGTTIFLMVWSHKIQGKKLVALASAYSLTDTAFRNYRNKVEEVVSNKKIEEINHGLNQDKVSEMTSIDNDILATNRGDVLCVDVWTGLKFYSNASNIKDAINAVNAEMVGDIYVRLGYLYEQLGIPPQLMPKCGNELGWNVLADKQVRVEIDSCLDKENIPTLTMEYFPKPSPMFDTL